MEKSQAIMIIEILKILKENGIDINKIINSQGSKKILD